MADNDVQIIEDDIVVVSGNDAVSDHQWQQLLSSQYGMVQPDPWDTALFFYDRVSDVFQMAKQQIPVQISVDSLDCAILGVPLPQGDGFLLNASQEPVSELYIKTCLKKCKTALDKGGWLTLQSCTGLLQDPMTRLPITSMKKVKVVKK